MRATRIWRIGLTGGIGSGKSTIASMFAERGAAIIDADAISRSLTAPGGRAIGAIRQQFGEAMIGADGAMDRQAMRARVFSDPQARHQLEAIIHPLVGQITQEQSQAALQAGRRCLVHDVPLLVESGLRWRRQVDRILVVDCDTDTQRQRVVARSALAPEEVDRIIAQQATRVQRLACADLVIFNQGLDLQALRQQVNEAARHFGL
jgi:dephospho-CoA kinase